MLKRIVIQLTQVVFLKIKHLSEVLISKQLNNFFVSVADDILKNSLIQRTKRISSPFTKVCQDLNLHK